MRRSLVYAAILAAGVSLELLLLNAGQRWAPASGVMPAGRAPAVETAALFTTLLQIIVVILMARLLRRALSRLGQPAVIGEIAAGVVLGPSLLGRISPAAFALLFPASSLPNLVALSQIGLILFMFGVGLEFAPELMRERRESILVISHASIIVPFVLGTILALHLYPSLAEKGVSFRAFALFLGISMSITAFPVLARILTDRHLLRTNTGNTAIACAAVDDVTAWCMLGLVVVIVRAGSPAALALKTALLVIYLVVMVAGIRPLLRELMPRFEHRQEALFAGALLLMLVSSATTEVLGIHSLFGAFVAGAILPRSARLHAAFVGQVRGLTSVLFLPLFFAVTGLRTNLGLLFETPALWIACSLILVVAIVGKLCGAMVSAVTVGIPWREAAAIGVLMNTRGLMELVVLNIGLEIGVISRTLFTMIVIMAVVTTAMTGPLLDRLVTAPREVEDAAPELMAAASPEK